MAGYHLLPSTKEHDRNDDETATPSSIGPAAAKSKPWKYISALASFLLICIITLVAVVPTNHQVLPNEAAFAEDLSFLTPPGPVTKTFTLDEVFRQRPSPESDEAWRSILPSISYLSNFRAHNQKVTHADDGRLRRWSRHRAAPIPGARTPQSSLRPPAPLPRQSLPSISHSVPLSLSLLNGLMDTQLTRTPRRKKPQDMIRKTYFTAREDCSAASSENDKHTVHCLDYLRQALQCHADTNLEHRVVSGTGTGTGMGDVGFTGYSEHKCRDFERVFRFAEEWRVYEGKNGSARVRVSEGEMGVGRVIDYDYVSSRGGGETMVG